MSVLVRNGTSPTPSSFGTVGLPPVLMKISGASSSRSSTRIVRGLSKRPWPWISVTFGAFFSQFVTPLFDCATISSLRALTRAMSMPTGPSITTPKSPARRATWAARALAISVLVGMQPTLTQVPPTRFRSRIAVLRPAEASRTARGGPACPVPMMIASKRSVMRPPLPQRADAAAPQRPPRYAVARLPRETGSWITTPSIGSTGAVHGARSTMRFVSAYPACQRARMPAGVKSMSFV